LAIGAPLLVFGSVHWPEFAELLCSSYFAALSRRASNALPNQETPRIRPVIECLSRRPNKNLNARKAYKPDFVQGSRKNPWMTIHLRHGLPRAL
jgi:hypothetical protein